MDTEDQILKSTKLITNTKKQRLKIQSRGQTLKNTILKMQSKINHKIIYYIHIYEICFKKWVLLKGYKNEKGVIKNLKIKKL